MQYTIKIEIDKNSWAVKKFAAPKKQYWLSSNQENGGLIESGEFGALSLEGTLIVVVEILSIMAISWLPPFISHMGHTLFYSLAIFV